MQHETNRGDDNMFEYMQYGRSWTREFVLVTVLFQTVSGIKTAAIWVWDSSRQGLTLQIGSMVCRR